VIGTSTQAAGLRGSQACALALNVLAHDIEKEGLLSDPPDCRPQARHHFQVGIGIGRA
jgi:hypothetical protein